MQIILRSENPKTKGGDKEMNKRKKQNLGSGSVRRQTEGKTKHDESLLSKHPETKKPWLLGTRLNEELWKYPGTTLRTWLLLLALLEEYEEPLVFSISEIAQFSHVCKPISARAVSNALHDLESLYMIEVDRRGNVSVIRFVREQ